MDLNKDLNKIAKNEDACLKTLCTKEVTRDDKAPLFEAEAYYRGKQVTIKLDDYLNKGKWLMLLFYSSDFTFV